MASFAWIFTVVALFTLISNADNDFTYTGSPVAGKPFTIAWTPGTYSTIDILLYTLTGYPYYVPTTGVPIVGMWEGISLVFQGPREERPRADHIQRELPTREPIFGTSQQL